VQNERVDGRVQQHVIGSLGRLDVLQKSGQLDGLLASCARFAEQSAVLSAHRQGRPVCCELWPGNTADVTTLIPIVDRLKQRFHIRSVCVVADRGMISRETIRQLQAADRDVRHILGARLRSVKEIDEVVLRRPGRYHQVYGPKGHSKDPAPLKVKQVQVEWQRLRDDLDALEEITVRTRGRTFVIRSQTQGDAGKAIQAAGVALGSVVRLEDPSPHPENCTRKRQRSAKDHARRPN